MKKLTRAILSVLLLASLAVSCARENPPAALTQEVPDEPAGEIDAGESDMNPYAYLGANYTEEDGALLKLNETELTAEVFETYGIQDVPDGSLLLGLTDPTILYWHDSENRFPPFMASITGIPKPQIVYSENIDMSDASILGIEKVVADCDDAVIFAVSFDNGETWWAYINDEWGQLSEEDSGMSKAAIESISADAWSQKAVTGQLKYRFVISGADGYIRSVTTDYLNREE